MDTKQPGQPASILLLSLAEELLLAIVEQIDSHETLRNVAAACSRLQRLAEPFIWRSLLVRRGSHAANVARALRDNPTRTSSVQDLSVCYLTQVEDGIEELNPVIRCMDKLRRLTIESPCPNDHGGWRGGATSFPSWTRVDYTLLFEEAVSGKPLVAPLQLLQSVTLHGHRSSGEPFLFGRTAIIFFHPTLRHLTLSCTNFDASIELSQIPPQKLNSTPLQSLSFIECNVYLSFLNVVMSLPKALKTLSVGERLYAWDGCYPVGRPRTSHPEFLDVLEKQADSLERLVHIPGNLQWNQLSPPTHDDVCKLRNLTRLKHLELDQGSFVTSCLQSGGMPDSVQTLKLSNATGFVIPGLSAPIESIEAFIGAFLLKAHKLAVKGTSTALDLDLNFTHARGIDMIEALSTFWAGGRTVDQLHRLKVYEIATILKARGSRFRILAEMFEGGASYIPPYMYGEEVPKEALQYTSDSMWMFSKVNYQNLDQDDLPRNLKAVCMQCRKSKVKCENEGFGTTCRRCDRHSTEEGSCEYPPMVSPWSVSAGEMQGITTSASNMVVEGVE